MDNTMRAPTRSTESAARPRIRFVATHPTTRRLMAVLWTLLVTVMLLQSSGHPVVGPPAPPGPPDFNREIQLTIGHIITFSVLTLLLWWALRPNLSTGRSLFVTLAFTLIYGVITELAQMMVVDREPSFYDMAINASTAILVGVLIYSKTVKRGLP